MDQFEVHSTVYVGLDSVVEQKATYERRGFVASELGKIRCMSYTLSSTPNLTTTSDRVPNLLGFHLIDLKEIPYEILVQSDYDHTGFERDGLWNGRIQKRADFSGLALVEKGKPHRYRLGPVYASNAAASRTLIMAAMQTTAVRASAEQAEISDVHIAAEVWGGNPHAVKIFEELGWNCTDVDYYRMWLHGVTPSQQDIGGLAHRGMFAIFDAVVG
ncbi:hypothetical protein E4T52_06741 [Aureobasidium sp. EXF-3400]|nr:hypothetical protein E4T51_16555 [Aureobasidium sp. EXF-12344]KAI4778311.1 hypothetical protein E4T52_06741 [Aureobasidium sp. EXF-3400]